MICPICKSECDLHQESLDEIVRRLLRQSIKSTLFEIMNEVEIGGAVATGGRVGMPVGRFVRENEVFTFEQKGFAPISVKFVGGEVIVVNEKAKAYMDAYNGKGVPEGSVVAHKSEDTQTE